MAEVKNNPKIGKIEKTADVLSVLIDILSNKEIKKDMLFYRGQSKVGLKLIPSVARDNDNFLCANEQKILQQASHLYPNLFTNDLLPFHRLAIAQHYGIPTRLLDVTTNILVALYFACSSNFNSDGELFIFKADINHTDCNYAAIHGIADFANFYMGGHDDRNYQCFMEWLIEQPYSATQRSLLKSKVNNAKECEKYFNDIFEKPIFVTAPRTHLRQDNQASVYILFPTKLTGTNRNIPTIEPLSKTSESIIRKLTIPKEYKNKILEELRLCNISKEKLFPENIEENCKDLIDGMRKPSKKYFS